MPAAWCSSPASIPAGTRPARPTCTSRCTSTGRPCSPASSSSTTRSPTASTPRTPTRSTPAATRATTATRSSPRPPSCASPPTAGGGSARSSSACPEPDGDSVPVLLEQRDDLVGRLGDVERDHRDRPLGPLVDQLDREVPRHAGRQRTEAGVVPVVAYRDLHEPLVGQVRGQLGDVRFGPLLRLGGVGQNGIDERHAETLLPRRGLRPVPLLAVSLRAGCRGSVHHPRAGGRRS